MKKRVAIGTAQFGSDYGINNKTGRLSDEEINQVLNICSVNDISFLDTAYVYGDSEKRIGKYCEENKRYFSIITKLPDCNINEFDKIFNDSLLRLKTDNVYGYLIHNINSFRKNPEIFNKLRKKKEAGKIKKIGFSLYNADELQMLFDIDFNFDLIQFPYNIFDRRFEPYFDTLKEKNVEIHTRSVYLQGLFFINPEELNIYFNSIKDKLDLLRKLSDRLGIRIQALCLSFVMKNKNIDKIVIGIDNKKQCLELIENENQIENAFEYYDELKKLKVEDINILLPYKWKK